MLLASKRKLAQLRPPDLHPSIYLLFAAFLVVLFNGGGKLRAGAGYKIEIARFKAELQ